MMEGRRDESIAFYRRIIAIDPTNEEVAGKLKGLEQEFQEKKIDLEDGSNIRKAGPKGELATMTLAGIYAAQGYYNKALKIYREILEDQPDNSEAAEMAAKIEEMIESSNREVEEAFEEDVMTISIDDVSDDMAESTAGPGTGPGGGDDTEREEDEGEEPGEVVLEGSVLGDEDELEKVARELEEADRGKELDGGEQAGENIQGSPDAKEGMDNFRRWLQKMHDDTEE
jgi:tetratricopeptide (TPR) repeat protein